MSRRRLLAAAAGCLVAACTSDTARERPPRITFAHRPPLRLAVDRIDIVELPPTPPTTWTPPNPPDAALARWARDRLSAAGGSERARFVVTEAAMIETTPPPRTGTESYQAVAAATVEIVETAGAMAGHRIAYAESRAERTLTLPAAFTVNQREVAWFEMIEALMGDFDTDMDRRIREHLATWLV